MKKINLLLSAFFRATICCFLAAIPLSASKEVVNAGAPLLMLEFGPTLQELGGWGFTPAPSDWDGMMMAREPEMVARLFRDAGASVARFVVGKTHDALFEERAGKLNPAVFDRYIGRYIRALSGAGMEKYVLSIATPPKWMKKYFTDASHLHLDRNSLRSEYVVAFTKFVTEILHCIKAQGLPEPAGISLQEQPDIPMPAFACPPALPQGCLYAPDAYARLVQTVRTAMDREGYSHIALVGPETGAPALYRAYTSPALSGVIVRSSFGLNAAVLGDPFPRSCQPWIKGTAPGTATGTAQTIFEVGKRLTHDLSVMGARYWLWPYGFAQDDTGEVLRYGTPESDAQILQPLTEIWHSFPRNGKVRKVLARNADGIGSAQVGFAVDDGRGSVTMILFNPYTDDVRYAIPANSRLISLKIFDAEKWKSTTPARTVSLSFEGISIATLAFEQ